MDQKLYQETFDEIHVPKKLSDRLERIPDQEGEHIKYRGMRKPVLVLAAAMILCIGATCYAAVMGVRTESYTAPASLKHGIEAVQEAQEETGLSFYCPEKLENGYSYLDLNINDDVDYDEDGKETGTWKSVYAGYMDESGYTVTYQISPIQEAACRKALEDATVHHQDMRTYTDEEGNTISFYYTAQSVQMEESDVTEEESVVWSSGDQFYRISGYDSNLSAAGWLDMAEEFMEKK